MYTQTRDTSVEAYDFETNAFIGKARFSPTISAQNSLLNWFNYGVIPKMLTMVSSNFQPSENYVPIIPNETYHQRGILRTMVKDANINKWIRLEVPISYDWKSRSPEPGYFISSVEFSNIKQEGPIAFMY